jgi:uncharacterized BrkB/YihY/UPF0761 family membrane protein
MNSRPRKLVIVAGAGGGLVLVWVGAVVTSALFNVGKLSLGLYLGKGAVSSSYGAAGSILVVLLWIYYSGLIFLLRSGVHEGVRR